MSITTPLAPPVAARVAVVPVGRAPLSVWGTEKDMRHPALLGQFTAPEVEPKDCTLRNIRSVLALNTSVTGEQVVFPDVRARMPVPVAAAALDVIRS